MEKIVIVDGARTPVGSYNGSMSRVPAHELGATAVRTALVRSGCGRRGRRRGHHGCIGQVGPDGYNARRVALAAGLSPRTPAYTVNRLCGSGLQSIWAGAMQLRWGGTSTVVAGDESMSRMPFLDFAGRSGARLGHRELIDGTVAMLTDPFTGVHMGVTAENVASKYGVSRQEQDEFAVESQRHAATPEAQAAFADEITPVTVSGKQPTKVATDEHPRPETTLEDLDRLRPAFQEGGTVTAGNASGINDGAAAIVLMQEGESRERGLCPLAVLEDVATAGVEPEIMGYAPRMRSGGCSSSRSCQSRTSEPSS